MASFIKIICYMSRRKTMKYLKNYDLLFSSLSVEIIDL